MPADVEIKPEPIPSNDLIPRLGYGAERQRQEGLGWYARGSYDDLGNWAPEPGLPSEVIVQGDFPHPAYREQIIQNGGRILSRIPRGMVTGPQSGFNILPPTLEDVADVCEQLKGSRHEAIADIDEEIAEIDFRIGTPNALAGGEAMQYRKKRQGLEKRKRMLLDDGNFDPLPFYRAYIGERKATLRAMMGPEARKLAAIQTEYEGWEQREQSIDAAVKEIERSSPSTSPARSRSKSSAPEPETSLSSGTS